MVPSHLPHYCVICYHLNGIEIRSGRRSSA
jgi:hypothetical protein